MDPKFQSSLYESYFLSIWQNDLMKPFYIRI